MNRSLMKTAIIATAGLAIAANGASLPAAMAATHVSAKPTTTCSKWQLVGDSTVSARTCLTIKAGKATSLARGSVQVKNTGTAVAQVKATWTLSVQADDEEAATVRTVTVRRAVPANGHTFKLGGTSAYSSLDASALAEVVSKIVVVAKKSGTDTEEDDTSAEL